MSQDFSHTGDRALFNRLKAVEHASSPAAESALTAETMLALAAWIERGRQVDGFDEAALEGDAVEALLAEDPELLGDVLALIPPLVPESPSAEFLARAQSVVPVATQAAIVLPFSSRAAALPASYVRRKASGAVLAWSALAACLAFISIVGFNMGMVVEHNFYNSTDHEMSIDILDAPNAALDGTS